MKAGNEILGVTGASNETALRLLMARTGFPIEQRPGTGQRIYGPPPVGHPLRDIGEPGRGCEVFVGKIPRDCYEDELIPVLERCGPVYELRMMMDFVGTNRGFCFVTFIDNNSARRAVKELNDYEIRKGRKIGVCPSVDNCRLFLGGLPRDKHRPEILENISKLVPGVRDVIVKPDARDKQKNRGFAFVEFETHHLAAMARRKLVNKGIRMWDQVIAVDWAEPEPEVDREIMEKVKILYFRNLMLHTTESTLELLCAEVLGRNDALERVKKLKDYAFVHFKERKDALLVMEQLNGRNVDGADIEIVLSKPVEKKPASKEEQAVPAHLGVSFDDD
ncbi:hypothetical protein HELRODRAFT_76754 [Helobdella robusta]|uniref:RRM domain-containing protein n=1 Tax=Helobdella robusta TaxID=6412 RepID=T1G2P0_HELRO|nr:hypothetical protein HELRODRAFT_76754 [Helobdella robusta]ESO07097.1 hypothetical protein HELRODRAFT_76754 [Helobdella robusta]